MSSRQKKLHKEIQARVEMKEHEQDLAQRKACLLEDKSELRYRIFISCAIVDGLGGAYVPDFGFWNKAYWSDEYWQKSLEKAEQYENEFKKTGAVPSGFFSLPPVDPVYDESVLEYNRRFKPTVPGI